METDKKQNQHLFIDYGYRFGDEILEQALYGQYMYTHRVAESTSYFSTHKRVNTHIHGIYLLHSADAIKITIGMPIGKVKTMMERLFRKGGNSNKKLLNLNTAEFYAFVVNNEHLLKEEFREVTAEMSKQSIMNFYPKTSAFYIPEQDFLNMILEQKTK